MIVALMTLMTNGHNDTRDTINSEGGGANRRIDYGSGNRTEEFSFDHPSVSLRNAFGEVIVSVWEKHSALKGSGQEKRYDGGGIPSEDGNRTDETITL